MAHGMEADRSTRKPRERELYTIPISSSWFKWDEIHDTERRSLPEFFEGGSYSRSPRVYKEYRDFIINKYREDPSRRLTFTDVRKSLVGDVCTLRRVFLFLEKWGLINFSASDRKQQPKADGPRVVVEDSPDVGVRVAPEIPSSSYFVSTKQVGGEILSRLPPLASYSDAFGEWESSSDYICGLCGGHCPSGMIESSKGCTTLCSECSLKEGAKNEKREAALMLTDDSDIKYCSSAAWTDVETLHLLEAVLKHGDDWDLIAQHVRTKNKADCISRLIHLPFGEHMLGTVTTKLSNRNLITLLEDCQASLQVINDNPAAFAEIGVDEQVESNKAKVAENVSEAHSLNPISVVPFTDIASSFMKEVASLSTVCGPHVTAAAIDAAIGALCEENPCARLAFVTTGDKLAMPISPPNENGFKSDIKLEDEDAENYKPADSVPERKFGAATAQVRAAIAASLAAAAARAKLAADQEERKMELLLSSIIQAQLKKVQHKMQLLKEAEQITEAELGYVQQVKQGLVEDWATLLHKAFHAGLPRWRDHLFPPNALSHTFPL